MILYSATAGRHGSTNASTLLEVDFTVSASEDVYIELRSLALYNTTSGALSVYIGEEQVGVFSAPDSSVRTATLTRPIALTAGQSVTFMLRAPEATTFSTVNETYLVTQGPLRTHLSTKVQESAGTTRVLPIIVSYGMRVTNFPDFDPVYGSPNETGRPRIVAGYTSDGFLDGLYQQPYLAVMQTELGEWLMNDAGYTLPPIAIPFYQPKQGRGWPTRTLHSNYRPQSG